jgi:hypothetical protein
MAWPMVYFFNLAIINKLLIYSKIFAKFSQIGKTQFTKKKFHLLKKMIKCFSEVKNTDNTAEEFGTKVIKVMEAIAMSCIGFFGSGPSVKPTDPTLMFWPLGMLHLDLGWFLGPCVKWALDL